MHGKSNLTKCVSTRLPDHLVEETDTENNTASPSPESKFEKLILDKLHGIEMRIDETISKKLAENYTKFDAKISKASESYADSIKQNVNCAEKVPDFRKIIEDTKNEELVLQKERETRAPNIIINGLPEEADTPVKQKAEDIKSIREFLDAIEVASMPEFVTRLGRRNDNNYRPIKIKMKNQNDKDPVMSNLNKLKQASEILRKVSVTDDYTVKEREEIKKQVEEAKSKTELEGDGKYVFKVRGTQKRPCFRRFTMTITGTRE